jgi:hypothetical protein
LGPFYESVVSALPRARCSTALKRTLGFKATPKGSSRRAALRLALVEVTS